MPSPTSAHSTLRALAQYLDRTLRERIVRLEALPSPGAAIVGFFKEVVERSLADPWHRGCMLVNTALEATSDDRDLQRIVANHTLMIERFFHGRVVAGQRAGEIPDDQPADDIAKLLLSVVMGLRVLARVRPEPGIAHRPRSSRLGDTQSSLAAWQRQRSQSSEESRLG